MVSLGVIFIYPASDNCMAGHELNLVPTVVPSFKSQEIKKFQLQFFFLVYLTCAQREYFKQGKIEQFRQILEEGSGPG